MNILNKIRLLNDKIYIYLDLLLTYKFNITNHVTLDS